MSLREFLRTDTAGRLTPEALDRALRIEVASRVFRTGKQTLWRWPDGSHTVSIRNRSYHAEHPIPADKVAEWKRRLG